MFLVVRVETRMLIVAIIDAGIAADTSDFYTELLTSKRDWYRVMERDGLLQRPLHPDRFTDQDWLDVPAEEDEGE